jgi:hypothetical protein
MQGPKSELEMESKMSEHPVTREKVKLSQREIDTFNEEGLVIPQYRRNWCASKRAWSN